MKKLILFAIVVVLVVAMNGQAFNGKRQGFVLGGGLGFGPVANVALDGFPGDDLENSGLAINFVIGYAPNEQSMIVFLRDAVIYSETIDLGFLSKDISLAQGFTGIGYYHYFGPVGKSSYLTAGLGLQDWTSMDDIVESNDAGLGILLGGGYEFARHVQLHGSLSFGKSSDIFFDYNHTQLIIGISAIAF